MRLPSFKSLATGYLLTAAHAAGARPDPAAGRVALLDPLPPDRPQLSDHIAYFADGLDRQSRHLQTEPGSGKMGDVIWSSGGHWNPGASWYYNYSPYPSAFEPGKEFIPMIRDRSDLNADATQAVKNAPAVLGFNEPDNSNMNDGSNMSVEEAVAGWKQLQGSSGKLVSPATVNPTNQWMQDFMAQADNAANGMRVDVVAVHHYEDNGGSVQSQVADLKNILTDTSNMYHKPIWVTEFGQNNGALPDPEFVKEATQMLDALPFVEKYALF